MPWALRCTSEAHTAARSRNCPRALPYAVWSGVWVSTIVAASVFGTPARATSPTVAGTRSWWVAFAAPGVLVLVHFSLVLLYVVPSNSISDAMQPLTFAYLRPLFTQNWRLFSPDPPTRDASAFVRGTFVDDDKVQTTDWLPLTDALVKVVQDNRLKSLALTRTTLYEAVYSVLDDPSLTSEDTSVRQQAFQAWSDMYQQPAGLVALESAGSAALQAAYGGVTFREVQVGITLHTFPSFDNRSAPDDEGPTASWAFPPVPYQQVVQ